jgi:hypothetical protein
MHSTPQAFVICQMFTPFFLFGQQKMYGHGTIMFVLTSNFFHFQIFGDIYVLLNKFRFHNLILFYKVRIIFIY